MAVLRSGGDRRRDVGGILDLSPGPEGRERTIEAPRAPLDDEEGGNNLFALGVLGNCDRSRVAATGSDGAVSAGGRGDEVLARKIPGSAGAGAVDSVRDSGISRGDLRAADSAVALAPPGADGNRRHCASANRSRSGDVFCAAAEERIGEPLEKAQSLYRLEKCKWLIRRGLRRFLIFGV